MKNILALSLVFLLLFGCVQPPRLTGAPGDDPAEFGNSTDTTVYVGGTAGIVNATGQLIGENLTLTGTTCGAGETLTSSASGVSCVAGGGSANITNGTYMETAQTLEPTGFASPNDVIVSLNATNLTITLNGNTTAYYRGVLVANLTDGWKSDEYPNYSSPFKVYLKYNSSGFSWSNNTPEYDALHIAAVAKQGSGAVGLRQTYGLMNWQAHRNTYETDGAYKITGGDIYDYTLLSTTLKYPKINNTTIAIADLQTVIPENTNNTSYAILGGSSISAYSSILIVAGNVPYYLSLGSGYIPIASGNYAALWLIAVPAANDSTSQSFRYLWVQPTLIGTKPQAQGLVPSDIISSHRALAGIGDYVFLKKVIIYSSGLNWYIDSVQDVTGTQINQETPPFSPREVWMDYDATTVSARYPTWTTGTDSEQALYTSGSNYLYYPAQQILKSTYFLGNPSVIDAEGTLTSFRLIMGSPVYSAPNYYSTLYHDAQLYYDEATGTLTSTAFVGDGSGLTGLPSGGNTTNCYNCTIIGGTNKQQFVKANEWYINPKSSYPEWNEDFAGGKTGYWKFDASNVGYLHFVHELPADYVDGDNVSFTVNFATMGEEREGCTYMWRIDYAYASENEKFEDEVTSLGTAYTVLSSIPRWTDLKTEKTTINDYIRTNTLTAGGKFVMMISRDVDGRDDCSESLALLNIIMDYGNSSSAEVLNQSVARIGDCADGYAVQNTTTEGVECVALSAGSGTVTDITAGTGLTGGTITTSGTIALDTTYTDGRYSNLSLAQVAASIGNYSAENSTIVKVSNVVGLVGNWSADKPSYTATSGIATVMENTTIVRVGTNATCTGTNVLQNVTMNTSGLAGQCIAQSGSVANPINGSGTAGYVPIYKSATEIGTGSELDTETDTPRIVVTSTGATFSFNASTPALGIENWGDIGGAEFWFKDNKSYSWWKFKAINAGGFKLRDHNYGIDVMTFENNATANMIYGTADDKLGFFTSNPTDTINLVGNTTINGTLRAGLPNSSLSLVPTGSNSADFNVSSGNITSMYLVGSSGAVTTNKAATTFRMLDNTTGDYNLISFRTSNSSGNYKTQVIYSVYDLSANTFRQFFQFEMNGSNVSAVDVAGSNVQMLRLGAATNILNISAWGNMTFYNATQPIVLAGNSSVWDDMVMPLMMAKAPASSSADCDATFKNGTKACAFSTGESLGTSMQMSHSYELGTNINCHLHWSSANNNTGNVTWGLEYSKSDFGGVFPDSSTLYCKQANNNSAGAYAHRICEFGSIGSFNDVSGITTARIFRNTTGDSYGSDAFGLSLDCHYEIDTLGSASEYGKWS